MGKSTKALDIGLVVVGQGDCCCVGKSEEILDVRKDKKKWSGEHLNR